MLNIKINMATLPIHKNFISGTVLARTEHRRTGDTIRKIRQRVRAEEEGRLQWGGGDIVLPA
jgi:hypothetical protein